MPEEMMQVEFVQDYRGELTAEEFYPAGARAVFPASAAGRLVQDGRAVYADDDVDAILTPLTPQELAPATPLEEAIAAATAPAPALTGDGEGEALPPVTDPAEERTAPARRRRAKAGEE